MLEKFFGKTADSKPAPRLFSNLKYDAMKMNAVLSALEEEESKVSIDDDGSTVDTRNFGKIFFMVEPFKTLASEYMLANGKEWYPCSFRFQPADSHRSEEQLRNVIADVNIQGKIVRPVKGHVFHVSFSDATQLWARYGTRGWLQLEERRVVEKKKK